MVCVHRHLVSVDFGKNSFQTIEPVKEEFYFYTKIKRNIKTRHIILRDVDGCNYSIDCKYYCFTSCK